MIHACGLTDLPALVAASPDVVGAAREALVEGRPVYCDSMMVANGITRARLPAPNPVRCTLQEPGIADDARAAGTTRSAAAVDRWRPDLTGAVVVIGNAPTALFRLLELVLDGQARPAAILGLPVGFVGAAESKEALATLPHGVPFLTVHGRRGGSAKAVAALNAIASERE
jgi:precorrin-8X/cobalt-precorrin-8 methylmutase